MKWVVPLLLSLALVVTQPAARAQKTLEPPPDLGKAAAGLASKLATQLVKEAPKTKGQKFRVAVFTFGDAAGKYPLALGDAGPVLRGALVDELRLLLEKQAPGKFSVLYPEQLDEQIRDSSTDPIGISGNKPDLARKLLKGLDVQVGIVGRFQLERDPFADSKIQSVAILPDKTLSAEFSLPTGSVRDLGFAGHELPPSRLSVIVQYKPDDNSKAEDLSAWKTLPLYSAGNMSGLLYLVLPKAAEGKRYRLILRNDGKSGLYNSNFLLAKPAKMDPDRLFSAAVLIDGMSVFMRPDGKEYRHVTGHPAALPKWILTPVGKRLVPDKAGIKGRVEGAKFEEVNGAGGSQIGIVGFQKGNEKAGSFVFARPQDSIAAPELLASRKIGTISAYFFAERFQGDEFAFASVAGAGGSGTKMGPDVRSATFAVKVLNWYEQTASVVRIVYRYEGDNSLPRDLKLAK